MTKNSPKYKEGDIIVRLKGTSSSSSTGRFFNKISGKLTLKASFGAMNLHHFTKKSSQSTEELLNELKQDDSALYAEPNYFFYKIPDPDQSHTALPGGQNNSSQSSSVPTSTSIRSSTDTTSPTDPNSSTEPNSIHSLGSETSTYIQNQAPVQVTETWSRITTQTSDRPIVAIVDTGVDYDHPVFVNSQAIWTNSTEILNGMDDDGNGYIDDINGWNFNGKNNDPMDDDQHGTHVAGIILGVGQNIFQNPAETSKIRIMPLKFLGGDGSGTTSDAIAAIYYAVQMGAQVINNSWGGENYSQSLHDALTFAYEKGVIITAAAGNYTQDNDITPIYPSNYPIPSQISVAATNDYDTLATFSNFGANSVHVASPGVSIRSTVPHNGYKYMSGTSMAAPFVAGVAALAIREAPHLSGYQIKNLILNTADYVPSLQGKVWTGARINSFQSIIAAQGEISTKSFQPNYQASQPNRSVASSPSMSSGGCGTISVSQLHHLQNNQWFRNQDDPKNQLGLIVALTLLPLIIALVLRAYSRREKMSFEDKTAQSETNELHDQQIHNSQKNSRRKFERFIMNSDVKIRLGEKELIGHMNTISLGGLSFRAEEMLEKGCVVTLQISDPEGKEQVQVQGHIVWQENHKNYGIQFDEARENVLSQISNWTQKLVKAN